MAVRDEDFESGLTLVEGDDGIWSSPEAAPASSPRDWRSEYEREHARAERESPTMPKQKLSATSKVATATVIAVEIVRKSPDQVDFAVQPRRWVVERFFAWINRNRRLAKDFEATIASARAFLYAASVMLLVRRLARAA